tara:strand:- start:9021 stop:9944 length:924 start_codon:yes stop_codon:yes gene_type:complete
MKIYLNRQPVEGPWGGGNHIVTNLVNRLVKLGHQVVFRLEDKIDIIFCFDPRPNNYGEEYKHFINYKNRYGTKIIQRVGDLGTHGKPKLTKLVKWSILNSDHLIFPSEWAKKYIGYEAENYSVIHNAPLEIFYKYRNFNIEQTREQINLITHHWSINPKKGFSFYQQLDEFVDNKKISFTYIGRTPKNFSFRNATHIPANGSKAFLAKKLAQSDIYVTASQEEAGANHVLEALAAGIPILYHKKGGSIIEYCNEYGLPFDSFKTFVESLENVINSYSDFKKMVSKYDKNIMFTIDNYEKIIRQIEKL